MPGFIFSIYPRGRLYFQWRNLESAMISAHLSDLFVHGFIRTKKPTAWYMCRAVKMLLQVQIPQKARVLVVLAVPGGIIPSRLSDADGRVPQHT